MGNADVSIEGIKTKGKQARKSQAAATPLMISDLGWSPEEAKETRARLAVLEEDWEAPGMEAYDLL
jgi:hypothetical protein